VNGADQLLFYYNDFNLLSENMNTTQEDTGDLCDAIKKIGVEVKAKENKYMLT
jgi:hypothetical protein